MRLIKNKKIITISLLFLITVIMNSSCANQSPDNQSNKGMEFLSDEAMNKKSEQDLDSYKFDTAKKGDFFEKVDSNASFYIQDSRAVRAEYKYGEMVFDEFNASVNTYVEAGDPIASVHIDVSNADIEEVKLSIQRMQERIETDITDYADDDNIMKAKAYAISDSQAQGIAIHEYEESVALHKQDIERRKQQVMDKQELLDKMMNAQSIKQITAPINGYLKELSVISQGDKLKDKDIIAVVEPTESNIITVNNKNNDFHYGKKVDVVITTNTGQENLKGMVITPSKISIASQVGDNTACIKLERTDSELPDKINIKKIVVTVKSNEVKNAVMVKRGSLEEDKSKAYATVVQKDGSLFKKSVIIGGQNKEYYWVIKGLEDGEKVVIP